MRIAMLSYHTCPLATLGGKDTGGMNVYVRELTRQLGVLGVHVDVFTRSQDEHVPHVLHDLGYGNRVVHITAGPEKPLSKEELVAFIPEFIQGVNDFAVQKGLSYDLIHSHYWMSGLAGGTLKTLWKVPLIQMFHTLGLMKQRVARIPGEAEGDYRIQGENKVISLSDRIVVATQAEYAQLQWLYQVDTRKMVIIPPGVDLSQFYPIPQDEAKAFIGVPPCEKVLLFVGRIEPLKGIDTLFKALAIMREQGVFVCLSVIGGEIYSSENPNEEIKRLREISRESNLSDLVTFLGRKGQNTLPYYYSAAEAVVVPSFYESFGMVALEAMACGVPVVASHVGGLAYLVQDGITGYTVPVDDPSALADRLIVLIKNPELRQKMGKHGAALAHEFGWERIAKRILALYDDLIESDRV